MTTANTVKVFFLGVIAALLLALVLKDVRLASTTANAQDSATAAGTVALVSNIGSGGQKVALFIIDTATKHLALYVVDDGNKFFNLVAARNYGYDVGIDYAAYTGTNKGDGYDVSTKIKADFDKVKSKTAHELYNATQNK
jgi:hypothetical protein